MKKKDAEVADVSRDGGVMNEIGNTEQSRKTCFLNYRDTLKNLRY